MLPKFILHLFEIIIRNEEPLPQYKQAKARKALINKLCSLFPRYKLLDFLYILLKGFAHFTSVFLFSPKHLQKDNIFWAAQSAKKQTFSFWIDWI